MNISVWLNLNVYRVFQPYIFVTKARKVGFSTSKNNVLFASMKALKKIIIKKLITSS